MSALPFLRRRRERRIEQRQQAETRRARSLATLGITLLGLSALFFLAGAFIYASLTANLPPVELLPALVEPPSGSLLQPTRLYDRSGEHLLAVLAPQDAARAYLPLDPAASSHIPDAVQRAVVALTEPGFWASPGCSLIGLTDPSQHPTIAQKLAADLLLWDEAPSLRRAIRERILAAQLVSTYGRQKVLEWYLNTAWFGRYAYGIDPAARFYFGKPASGLTLAEAALLAAVSQSPAINPLDAPQAALQRQQEALTRIQQLGLVTPAEAAQARQATLSFQPDTTPPGSAPAFTALALAQLETRFNRARVERGGMVILTTLDDDIQTRAACILQTQLARLAGQQTPPCEGAAALPPLPPGQAAADASASAVVIDPRTGQILALVGDVEKGSASAFLTPHPPGSLLTPFVYLTGFTRGLSPATLTWDIPPAGSVPPAALKDYRGPMRLRVALVNDYPIPAGQVFNGMGAALIQQTLRPFGFDITASTFQDLTASENRYTVLEVARAYGIFAAQGTLVGYRTPAGLEDSALLAVRGADGRDYANWSVPASAQVVSSPLAYLVTDVLGDETVREGPQLFELGRPSAAAASVSGGNTWAVGYTPQRSAAVWLGGEGLSNRPAAGVWLALMQAASRGVSPDGWNQPAGVLRLNVCDPSGMLPTPACPNIVNEIFLEGYQPTQPDTLFRSYAIDRETGYLATVYTAPQRVEDRVYLNIPPQASAWAAANGIEAPPATYDSLRAPAPNPVVNITAPGMFVNLQGKVRVTGTAAGENFSLYRLQYGQGLNPSAWVLITEGKTPVRAGKLAEWDTSGLSGLYALQLLVISADNRLETATVQVTVDNDPPQVGLDFPREGAEISLAENPQIIFQPRVVDNLFVEKVEIYVDGKLLRSFRAEPFSIAWDASPGAHTVRVMARDRQGNQSELEINFTMK